MTGITPRFVLRKLSSFFALTAIILLVLLDQHAKPSAYRYQYWIFCTARNSSGVAVPKPKNSRYAGIISKSIAVPMTNGATAGLGDLQQRRHFLLMTTSPTKVEGERLGEVEGQRVVVFHAERRAVDDQVEAGNVRAVDELRVDLRIVLLQTCHQIDSGIAARFVDRDRADAGRGERGGDGRADATAPTSSTLAPWHLKPARWMPRTKPEPSNMSPSSEPSGALQDSVAGTGDLGGGGHFIDEADGRHLVRHGDEGAMHIAHAEDRP